MKKIAFISTMEGAAWGGSEELWTKTASRLLEAGYTVSANVNPLGRKSKQFDALRRSGCAITYRSGGNALGTRLLRKLKTIMRRGEPAYEWLDSRAPDLVLISQGATFDGLGWMEECIKRNISYAVIIHAACEAWFLSDDVSARLLQAYRSAKKVFFVSQKNLSLASTQLGATLANTKIIRNTYNVDFDVSLQWPAQADALKLACVARLDPAAKGQDLLFEVLKSEKWKQRPVYVTLFGEGICRDQLMRLKQSWQLDKVTFGGFESSVESIWKTHHSLILASRLEGLPLAVVEAMLCARPCIVTDVGGSAELIEDNVTGFVAKAPVAELMDATLERAWQKKDELRGMGQLAAQRIRKIIPRDPAGVFMQELTGLC